MIKVENKYDFTVNELTDILDQTPIRVDLDTNAAVAEYIIQALNVNRIIKEREGIVFENPKIERDTNLCYDHRAPFHLLILRNKDNRKIFDADVRTIAFYAYDECLGRPHKGIVSEEKPKPSDIANICELLGDIRDWGIFQ